MRLRARSPLMQGQEVRAIMLPAEENVDRFPVLILDGGGRTSLEAALANYEVIDATPEERRILHLCGYPFGGVQ